MTNPKPAPPALNDDFELVTPRLRISHILPIDEHIKFIHTLYNSSLFTKHQKSAFPTIDRAGWYVKELIPKFFATNNHGPYLLSLLPTDTQPAIPVGVVTLMRSNYTIPDIGFALLEEYTKKGYATEGGKRLIDYAVSPREKGGLGYEGCFGFTSPENVESKKMCERLGGVYWGDYPLEAFGGGNSAVYTIGVKVEGGDLRRFGIMGEKVV